MSISAIPTTRHVADGPALRSPGRAADSAAARPSPARCVSRARALVPVVLGMLLSACSAIPARAVAERKRNEEALVTAAAEMAKPGARAWCVVQDGKVAASGPTAEDAARAAPRGDVAHRFVFRAEDRGDRLWRMAFLPEGGAVAGRRLLADLGYRVVSAAPAGPSRPVVLERRGTKRTLDLAKTPRLRLVLTPIAGGATVAADIPLDPDFDGPLVLPPEAARTLGPERSEIPGHAEIQVLFGRPFDARRSWVSARCDALDASGVVELAVGAPAALR